MGIENTTGIVLNSKLVSEADITASILTEHFGRCNFIFKGLKKSKKRHLTAASKGSLLRLSFYYKNNRTSMYVNEFEVLSPLIGEPDNYRQILNAHFILEVILLTTPLLEQQQFVYKLLHAALSQKLISDYPYQLSAFFLIHILRHSGILPFNNQDQSFTLSHSGSMNVLTESMKSFVKQSLMFKFSEIDFRLFDVKEVEKLLFELILYTEEYFHISFNSKKLMF
jgi:recombinational DNA repair protein (RecF pathway)